MRHAISTVMLSTLVLVAATNAARAEWNADDYNGGYIVPYVGYFDVLRNIPAAQYGAEYRFAPIRWGIRPTIGVNGTSDSEAYGYAGFNWDIPLIDQKLYLIPNEMVGANHEGTGRQLGGAIEFRSGIELDYQFDNNQRIGASFNHISNASIYYHNPGAETALVNYSIPLATIKDAVTSLHW